MEIEDIRMCAKAFKNHRKWTVALKRWGSRSMEYRENYTVQETTVFTPKTMGLLYVVTQDPPESEGMWISFTRTFPVAELWSVRTFCARPFYRPLTDRSVLGFQFDGSMVHLTIFISTPSDPFVAEHPPGAQQDLLGQWSRESPERCQCDQTLS